MLIILLFEFSSLILGKLLKINLKYEKSTYTFYANDCHRCL